VADKMKEFATNLERAKMPVRLTRGGIAIAGQRVATGVSDSGDGEESAPAGGDAEHDVVLSRPAPLDF
jgi:hypothetical protein